MLASRHRMRRSADFRTTVARGKRITKRAVVLHCALNAMSSDLIVPARVGFVVPKSVGNAVVRNRTKRQLRAAMAAVLQLLPENYMIVIRARRAEHVTTAALTKELRSGLVALGCCQ